MKKGLVDLILELKKRCIQNEERIQTLCQVSLAEYKSILMVDENKKISCNILSKKMGLSPSRGSRVIENLVKKGYLIRMSNPADRRSTIISLSSTGIKLKSQIEEERYNCEKRIKKKLSEREIQLIKEGLELINKLLT